MGLACSVLLAVGFAEDTTERVVLPNMEVSAPTEKREAWRYSEIAGWEVFSQVSDVRARSLLQSLRKFDFALRIIQPRLVAGPASALSVILVDEPRYRTFMGPATAGDAPEFSTLIHRSGRSAIIVNTAAEFAIDDSAVSPGTIDTYRLLDRQYLRYVLAAKGASLPAWLEEGLAQTLTDVEYRGAWLNYGKVDTEQNVTTGDPPPPVVILDFLAPNSGLAGLSFKQVFAHRRFMPLGAFFAAKRADGSSPSPDSAWAKQAYAFVHFCLFGNKLRYREPLAKFATHLATEPMSEKLFKECFGVDYAKMEKELSGYLYYTRHKYQRYPLKPSQQLKLEPIEFREAAKAEIDRLKQLQP